jgi:hypothetical protein
MAFSQAMPDDDTQWGEPFVIADFWISFFSSANAAAYSISTQSSAGFSTEKI